MLNAPLFFYLSTHGRADFLMHLLITRHCFIARKGAKKPLFVCTNEKEMLYLLTITQKTMPEHRAKHKHGLRVISSQVCRSGEYGSMSRPVYSRHQILIQHKESGQRGLIVVNLN